MAEGRWAKAGAAFNGVIALANIFVVFIIYGQLRLLESQLNEMKSSSKQTDEAIAAAKLSASAAEISAKEASAANKIQLRPWIKVSVKSTKNLNSEDTLKWTMSVAYENIGKAPALQVQTFGALEVLEYP
jgi:hypothetical protein